MELLTNNVLVISLNVFAVCLWTVTIVMMLKRRLVSVKTNVTENKKDEQKSFKETLTERIQKQDLKKDETVIKIRPELMDVNKLYNKRLKNSENLRDNSYGSNEDSFFDYIKKRQNKINKKHINSEHKSIISMVNEGLTPFQIAKKMNKSLGEIELVMKINQHIH